MQIVSHFHQHCTCGIAFQVSSAFSAPALQFSPPGLQDLSLIESGAAETQHEVQLTNTGGAYLKLNLQAQCDANLRFVSLLQAIVAGLPQAPQALQFACSPHQARWMSLDQHNIILAPSQSTRLQIKLTAAALLQGTYHSQICVYNQTEHGTQNHTLRAPHHLYLLAL